jgi:hypothetical protein
MRGRCVRNRLADITEKIVEEDVYIKVDVSNVSIATSSRPIISRGNMQPGDEYVSGEA